MTPITRYLACGVLTLCTLHAAWGLPLDPEWNDAGAAPFPAPSISARATPLSALLQPRFEVAPLPVTRMATPRESSRFETQTAWPFAMEPGRSVGGFIGAHTASPTLQEFYLPPDIDLWRLSRPRHLDDSALKSYQDGLGNAPMPITIPEPQSASLLAIGLVGLGLRACWGARRRLR